MAKKILIIILVLLVLVQFVRPQRNEAKTPSPNDMRVHFSVPANVGQVLKRACYDCHSNHTDYPWYANVQPVGLWLQHHVDEGKEHLNFSEFGTYTSKKQAHKLEEVVEMIEKGEMPLKSYTIIHADAKLSSEEAGMLMNWAKGLKAQIEQGAVK